MTDPEQSPGAPEEERPPILGTWNRLYLALVLALAAQCAFYAWLTGWAS